MGTPGLRSRRSATLERQTRGALWNRKTIIRLTSLSTSTASTFAFDRPVQERAHDAAQLAGETPSCAVPVAGIEDREQHGLVPRRALVQLRGSQRADGDVGRRLPLVQEISR